MSMVINFAPLVEMVLMSRSFTVSMSAVVVPQSPGKFIRFLPTFSCIQYGSNFSER